jgi:hypothetical protein
MSTTAMVARGIALVAGCCLAGGVYAQIGPSGSGLMWGDGSLAPAHGYVGLHLGKSRFDPDCVRGLTCDDGDTAFKLTTGGVSGDISPPRSATSTWARSMWPAARSGPKGST